MSFDRSDYIESTKDRRHEISSRRIQSLERLQQAAVDAKYLTGEQSWDKFLSFVQAAMEETEKQMFQAQALMVDEHVISHEAMLQFKMEYLQAKAQAQAYRAVIALPSQLLAGYEDREDWLGKLKNVDSA